MKGLDTIFSIKASSVTSFILYDANGEVVSEHVFGEKVTTNMDDISTELTSVDKGVETYKTENQLTDIGYEAGLVLESNSELEKNIVDLTSQIKLID